jgi:hypothetical protein
MSDTQYGIRIPREIQFKPYDALVFIGKTPPPAAYFSFTGFVFLRRIFLPEDQGELDKYMSTANEWAKVFYVTYPDKHHALDPYPAPEMQVRGTGKTALTGMKFCGIVQSTLRNDQRYFLGSEIDCTMDNLMNTGDTKEDDNCRRSR